MVKVNLFECAMKFQAFSKSLENLGFWKFPWNGTIRKIQNFIDFEAVIQ